jgi:hypothetical protein
MQQVRSMEYGTTTGWEDLIRTPQWAETSAQDDRSGTQGAGASDLSATRRPLLVVLVVQAVISLRPARANTAFQDEAAYLWAGHLQWAHWPILRPLADHGTYVIWRYKP